MTDDEMIHALRIAVACDDTVTTERLCRELGVSEEQATETRQRSVLDEIAFQNMLRQLHIQYGDGNVGRNS